MKVVQLPIKPKQERGYYQLHHYVIVFQRETTPDKRWLYQVWDGDLVYIGEAQSSAMAHRRARARIRKIIRANEQHEERMVLNGE